MNSTLLLGVHDEDYPRVRQLKRLLLRHGPVHCVQVGTGGGWLERCRGLLSAGRVALRHEDAQLVVLAPFSLQYLPVAILLTLNRRRRPLVVDYFVGLVETNVEDWGHVKKRSLRAWAHRSMDWLAQITPTLVLTDTEPRARALERQRLPWQRPVVPLAVGAPEWAQTVPHVKKDAARPLRLLYYGNYIPLHGIDRFVRALSYLRDTQSIDVDLTCVGAGEGRDVLEKEFGERSWLTFVDPVPESMLPFLIQDADVVVGVFGLSSKAKGVIPNKVWQGLLCGKHVLTVDSPGVRSIVSEAGPLLHLVGDDFSCLADILYSLGKCETSSRAAQRARRRLASYLDASEQHVSCQLQLLGKR